MCQYCIEGGVLIPLLEAAYVGEVKKIDGWYISSCIQEEDNLYTAVDKARGFEDCCSIDIVICRLYEEFIFYGFDNLLYKKITTVFGSDFVDVFLKQRNALNNKQKISVIWENLYNKENYQNDLLWNNFISAKTELIEFSLDVLNFYYDWWIKGNKSETSYPMKRLEETGIIFPVGHMLQKESEIFDALFPWVYFSLMYLAKYNSSPDLIEKIALYSSKQMPGIGGYDLWLQRRAFIFFIQKLGMINALKKIEKIRIELIYYALLKSKIPIRETTEAIKILRKNRAKFYVMGTYNVDEYISNMEKVMLKD